MARRHDERGVTLVELLVVVVLMALVGGVLVSGVVANERVTRQVQERTYTSTDLQTVVERMGRDIRAADPVQAVVGASSLQIRVFRGAACYRYAYVVEGTELVQYTQQLTPDPNPIGSPTNYSACSTPTVSSTIPATAQRRVLIAGLASSAVFTYQDAAGATLAFPGATLSTIRTITVTVSHAATDRPDMVITTSVNVRNPERIRA